jgi:hypothetical protein
MRLAQAHPVSSGCTSWTINLSLGKVLQGLQKEVEAFLAGKGHHRMKYGIVGEV